MIPGKCFVIVVDESLDLVSVALQEVRHQDVRTELRGRDDVADGRAAAFCPEWMISVELVISTKYLRRGLFNSATHLS